MHAAQVAATGDHAGPFGAGGAPGRGVTRGGGGGCEDEGQPILQEAAELSAGGGRDAD